MYSYYKYVVANLVSHYILPLDVNILNYLDFMWLLATESTSVAERLSLLPKDCSK